MQVTADVTRTEPPPGASLFEGPYSDQSRFFQFKIICRNGALAGFEPSKISLAIAKASWAWNGGLDAGSARIRDAVVTDSVVHTLTRRQPSGGTFHNDNVQNQVELALMRSGKRDFARVLSEMTEFRKEFNFFGTRVVEYQTGGALSCD